jgi:hypothetical protein
VVTLYVFVSLSLPVSIFEIERSTSDLKRWNKNLKCCERNKQCKKWKCLVFFRSEIRVYSIYCKLNEGNTRGSIFLRKRIVRNTSSKFHGEWIYLEFFKYLWCNLLDLISGNLEYQKESIVKIHQLPMALKMRLIETFLLLPTWYTNFLFIHTNYIKLNSSTCFERNPLIIRRSTTQILHMQPLVSSLSASDRLVQRLESFLSGCARRVWSRNIKNGCSIYIWY